MFSSLLCSLMLFSSPLEAYNDDANFLEHNKEVFTPFKKIHLSPKKEAEARVELALTYLYFCEDYLELLEDHITEMNKKMSLGHIPTLEELQIWQENITSNHRNAYKMLDYSKIYLGVDSQSLTFKDLIEYQDLKNTFETSFSKFLED